MNSRCLLSSSTEGFGVGLGSSSRKAARPYPAKPPRNSNQADKGGCESHWSHTSHCHIRQGSSPTTRSQQARPLPGPCPCHSHRPPEDQDTGLALTEAPSAGKFGNDFSKVSRDGEVECRHTASQPLGLLSSPAKGSFAGTLQRLSGQS